MKAKQYLSRASEHSLQVSVLLYLSLHAQPDVFAFAIPNAGKRSVWAGRRLKDEGLTPGVADLCVMLDEGATGWIEMKTRGGKQSLPQRMFEEMCLKLGHHYALCRDLPEAIDALRGWGALKK